MTIRSSPTSNEIKTTIDSALDILTPALRTLNHHIYSNPETAYNEHHAHDSICTFLESLPTTHPTLFPDITITRHAYSLPTSFEAIAGTGTGGRMVNFNAEYDALPGIGHACGHNLITTSSVAGFLGLAALLKKFGGEGRVQLLGTPAEENGGGKARLVEEGAYEGVAGSLMAHPGPKELYPGIISDGIAGPLMNARKELHVTFTGVTAHAGGNPWDGVNALDALVSAYNNVSVLRQQIKPDERIHCAFLETPEAANVVPGRTRAYWQVRSPSLKGLNALLGRVRGCIEAGGLATGCEVEIVEKELYADIKSNSPLCALYKTHMESYNHTVLHSHPSNQVLTGSSDIGNVSYIVPTLHAMFAIPAEEGVFMHHPRFAEAAGTEGAFGEAVTVGRVLGLVGWAVLRDGGFYEGVKGAWEEAVRE
ncbi:M20 family metallopeptidase [Aspergillus chevalieri]|uniref:Peptidase M20 domain-containing protein 2 n=1 Tax=Aspergillus chevalieri TaxID=182096 RepID=A0A7R7ZIW8_ASPCH|nr:uncharacterized protein ACHE_10133S [Aspergillus chevalieri]BCR82731.1 hypothetical protein ACHE_10133S [Aspergillus chevalieri]